jgi:two-component system, chemotaxis family, protein-glutamate methylesterase/glutaminase
VEPFSIRQYPDLNGIDQIEPRMVFLPRQNLQCTDADIVGDRQWAAGAAKWRGRAFPFAGVPREGSRMAPIVVIGASQGGIAALQEFVRGLPRDFPAAILVVIHIGASPSILPSILGEAGKLPASHARHGERIRPGHIYIAPPDHHLLVEEEHVQLSRGPRENWTRPAIDPLFRSAALEYGPDAIGVILTGGLNDGTLGLYEIKRRGGVAIVQDPAEAEAPSMPASALANVTVDYCLPLAAIPGRLVALVREKQGKQRQYSGVRVMAEAEQQHMERPVAQTCPDCGGAMREEQVGTLTQFRCHIGHVMTAQVVANAQLEILERDLSAVLRMLNERAELCRDIGQKHRARGNG